MPGIESSIITYACQAIVYYLLMEPKYSKKITGLIYWPVIACLLLLFAGTAVFYGPETAVKAVPVMVTLPSVFLQFTVFKYRDSRFLFTFFLVDVTVGLGSVLVVVAATALGGDLYPAVWCTFASCILITALVWRFLKKPYRKALLWSGRSWRLLALVMGLFDVIMYAIAYLPTYIIYRKEEFGIDILIIVTFLLCVVAFLMMILEMNRQIEDKLKAQTERAEAKSRLQMTLARYEAMLGNQERLKAYRHDMRHHYQVMAGLVKIGDLARIRAYLGNLETGMDSVQLSDWCQSHVGNILIDWYASEIKRADAEFLCEVYIPSEKPEASADLCTVLGNALQNALEACSRMTGGRRYVRLTAKRVGALLFMTVENSFCGDLKKENGVFKSSKEEPGHGIGISSMYDIVNRRSGYLSIKTEKQVFSLSLAMGGVFLEVHADRDKDGRRDKGEKENENNVEDSGM